MPIKSKVAPGHQFTPDDLDVMQRVFDEVWAEHAPNIQGDSRAARDTIADAIINQATASGVEASALLQAAKAAAGRLSGT